MSTEGFQRKPAGGRDLYVPLAQGVNMQQVQAQEFLQQADESPLTIVRQGTEFLQYLDGFEKFWRDTRDTLIREYPEWKVKAVIMWGRTGVGKRLAVSELFYLADNDPVLQHWLEANHLKLIKKYISFAESANLARLEGSIDPAHGHGQYTPGEYREASKVHWRFVAGEFNNFEHPELMVIEPSGPTAYFDRHEERIVGVDRAFSTVYLLSQYHIRETSVFVIQRGEGLVEKILGFRSALRKASWWELPDLFQQAHLQINKGKKIVDLSQLSKPSLLRIKREMQTSMAPAEGVIRSNQEMDLLMRQRYKTTDESDFWPAILDDLGFTAYAISPNPKTDITFSLHQDTLDRYDPVKRYQRRLLRAI